VIRSLVTGGAGFLGSHIVDTLVELGHDVLVLDDLSGGYADNVNPAATLLRGSITDLSVLGEIFVSHQIDYIYHIAAYASEGLSHFIRRFNYTNNVIGSINLINAAVNHGGVKCFVYTSSMAVYGTNQVPFLESETPRPEDSYGIAKLAVEMDLKAAHRMFGLDYIVFRPHNVYGERQNLSDPYRNVIGIFMNQCMKGEPLTIFGDGTQTRAFSYISDVAPLIANSVNVHGDYEGQVYQNTFNVGADIPYSINRLAEAVQKAMGTKLPVTHLDKREEVMHAFSDHRKAQKIFNCKPKVTLEDGLARMAAWAKKRGPQKGKPFASIEIERNMPPSWRQLSWHGCPLP
jgi:UDP-glucose 4-epimerase